MAKGNFIFDKSVSEKERTEIAERVEKNLEFAKQEVSDREPVIQKRQDFFNGDHHKWTNVVGQAIKQQQGHILAVFNYILRFCQKLHQTLTNSVPRLKIIPKDEANEIETSRAERVEEAIYDVFKKNDFFSVVFKRCALNQIRDGDFTFECKVVDDAKDGKKIVIIPNENLLKIMVGWDDASGSSFSFVAFSDYWSVAKIKREYDYDAEPNSEAEKQADSKGDHLRDQFGIFASNASGGIKIPTGESKIPKAKITDYWGYEVIKGEVKVVNLIFINKDLVQFIVTDYKEIPRLIGHSLIVAGKPWSMSFIDPLIDPQIELNDRSSEEGDLIRVGSHMKFLVVNMPDFDPDSITPGSGQCVFIEGENADFRPLQMSISPFPSADYINRVLDHLFNLGLPKIALAAGTAPYTGKIAAIQYQAVVDIVTDYRIQWEIVMKRLSRMIQQYFIDYFPETHAFMRENILDETTGDMSEGELIIRDLEFDWDNVLPLSRSDKVVDASTMRDRNAISLSTYLEEAGFRDPGTEIKKLKKEAKDEELMTLLAKFNQFAPGVVKAQLEAQKMTMAAEEANAATMGATAETLNGATPKSTPPLLNASQNDGRRGVLTGTGTPTGQTATPKGAVAQVGQNMNAQNGV